MRPEEQKCANKKERTERKRRRRTLTIPNELRGLFVATNEFPAAVTCVWERHGGILLRVNQAELAQVRGRKGNIFLQSFVRLRGNRRKGGIHTPLRTKEEEEGGGEETTVVYFPNTTTTTLLLLQVREWKRDPNRLPLTVSSTASRLHPPPVQISHSLLPSFSAPIRLTKGRSGA